MRSQKSEVLSYNFVMWKQKREMRKQNMMVERDSLVVHT